MTARIDQNVIFCIPGERLGSTEQYNSGEGTFIRQGYICSSRAGHKIIKPAEKKPSIHILLHLQQNVIPEVNSIVTAKVTNVNPKFCRCAILSVGDKKLQTTFHGVLRKEDIRATEKDRVEMYKSFRSGDIILAKVLSLGDSKSYLLSTSANELGVVLAHSEAGATMVPISWCEMQCPKSHVKEFRKVAKVQAEHIAIS
ncbi:exosome complex component CSL4-like [Anneissia japonica]|uniref:exosome complex component CSL4-like n=1 Tax=Anneissia japonica TaxID=1529436 RepID=UPI0014258866|nr:exosome complex component CSL4-like [Anneissia japonica]